jgi:hypothetical protein
MALLSPGVQVSVTDESFSTGAGPGTVPLVFIATKQDKTTPDGTATAVGTTAANANNLYLISSQRELLQTFGNPDFNEVGGSAQNGYPLNEYGLLAAYSYLGVANRAYVIRADIDLAELDPLTTAPAGDPADGLHWIDLNEFVPGLFEYDGTAWVAQSVDAYLTSTSLDTTLVPSGYAVGDYIVGVNVDTTGLGVHLEYYKLGPGGDWELLDTNPAGVTTLTWSPHYVVPSSPALGDVWLKTTTPNSGLSINIKRYDSALGQFVDLGSPDIADTHATYYNSNLPNTIAAGTVVGFVDSGDIGVNTNLIGSGTGKLDVLLELHNGNTELVVTGGPGSSDLSTQDLVIEIGNGNGSPESITLNPNLSPAPTRDDVAAEINAAIALAGALSEAVNVVAGVDSTGAITLTNTIGEDIVLSGAGIGTANSEIQFPAAGTYSNFTPLDQATGVTVEASLTQPTGDTPVGSYWYDPSFDVDLLIKGATDWVELSGTLHVQSDEPTSGSANDIWVETDAGAAYPAIYRRNAGDTAWVLVDNTDQTSTLGVLFADARADDPLGTTYATGSVNNGTSGSGPDLDDDAPDPALYPTGMLLWNTRNSGRNVKVWTEDAVATPVHTTYGTSRWVSASGLNNDGSLITGPAAQKQIVIEALASTLTSNDDVRNDTIFYNLIAAPGFPELMEEMLALNVDRKEQAFIVGDSPFNLASDATSLQAWASNANNAAGNGDDGLVSADPYLGVYYPSGLSTNVDGSEVVVPASHMVMRQLAYNDQVAYPWFAPAGFSRGTITNATAVGYLDSEDEFVTVTLNEGQRDTLYNNNVNAIATLPGRGIVIWGQKTRNATAGALDRVNVARLVNYIRYQSDQLAQPFLFEPNDTTTRDAVKEAFDSFLGELVTLRGVTDFLVVVDESNNTPARIDRNELWVDIAIQPTKAVEFIYIPIRLRNTGEDLQPGA